MGSGLAGGASATLACLPNAVFECETDAQCEPLGDGARCEWVGFCSRPDDDCESNRRFHEFAGGGLASACTTPGGQEVWTRTYTSPGYFEDRTYSVAIDRHGDFAVIGHVSVDGQGFNVWVRKYTGDGDEVWTWVRDGGANLPEEGWSIIPVESDEFIVAGNLTLPTTGNDAWVARLSADGALVWEATYDGGQALIDSARDVTTTTGGDVVLIGYSTIDTNYETELMYQRRSPDGQAIRWTKTQMGLEFNSVDRAHGIAAVGDGFVGVGMKQRTDVGQYPWMTAFDALGEPRWIDEGPFDGRQAVWTAVAAQANGDVMLAGWRASMAGDADMWLQRRGPDGAILWDTTVTGSDGADDRANAVAVDDRGGFVIGGERGAGAGSTDGWIRRYDADHNEVWTATYSGPAGDRDTVWGVAIDPEDYVIACGYGTTPETYWDIWVRKYTP